MLQVQWPTSCLFHQLWHHFHLSSSCLFSAYFAILKTFNVSKLPTYHLCLLKIPEGVATEIERLQNQFLWRGEDASKRYYIKWNTVSKSKKAGGLALGRILD